MGAVKRAKFPLNAGPERSGSGDEESKRMSSSMTNRRILGLRLEEELGPLKLSEDCSLLVMLLLTVQMLDVLYVILSLSPSLAADNQGAWGGFINCLAARNIVSNFPLFLQDFHRDIV